MINNMIKLNEIPKGQLNELGLDEKMIMAFHPKELNKLFKGRLSPLLANMTLKNVKEGKDVSFPGKIRFVRNEQGKVNVEVYPINKELKNDFQLSKKDFERLKRGEPVMATVTKENGKETLILQCDKETNAVMSLKARELRIPNAIGDVILGEDQKEQFMKGLPIVLDKGDTQITVGVDLDDPTGCMVINGGMEEWEKRRSEKETLQRNLSPYGDIYCKWKETPDGLVFQKQQTLEENMETGQKKGFGLRR